MSWPRAGSRFFLDEVQELLERQRLVRLLSGRGRQVCLTGSNIQGVSLHSYRYAWAERALQCGYPERFAQQALGHNSKAVQYAYAKNAEVTVPSLEDWETQWKAHAPSLSAPTLVPVDFKSSGTSMELQPQQVEG